MRIEFENLGAIKKGIIDLKNLNIFCGQNNTGKTYINYLLYTVLNVIKDFFIPLEISSSKEITLTKNEIKLDFTQIIEEETVVTILNFIEKRITEKLPQVFLVDKEFFSDFKIKIEINRNYIQYLKQIEIKEENVIFWLDDEHIECTYHKRKNSKNIIIKPNIVKEKSETSVNILEDQLKNYFFNLLIKKLFLLNSVMTFPAERSSLAIFYKDLFSRSYNLLDLFMRNSDEFEKIKNTISKYPKPLSDYINFLNECTTKPLFENESSFLKIVKKIEKQILKGKYQLNDDKIVYNYSTKLKELELYSTSSLVKTIVGITFYLKYMARKHDYFLIDEPELNLHPRNQRQLARIFAMMINSGIKVIMTTHSPYIMNEFNNLIMLGKISDQERKAEIMSKYKISENEILSDSNVSSYLIINGQTKEMKKTDYGLELDTFNEVIDEMNDLNDEIYSAIED